MRSNTYPHMCRDGHQEIGHSDSEHEQCPLCRALALLENYGRHKSNCKIVTALPIARLDAFKCSCGWDEVRATFREFAGPSTNSPEIST